MNTEIRNEAIIVAIIVISLPIVLNPIGYMRMTVGGFSSANRLCPLSRLKSSLLGDWPISSQSAIFIYNIMFYKTSKLWKAIVMGYM
jgi:hypothetical protein